MNEAFEVNGETLVLGCSIGIAIYPDDGITNDALLAAADKAMYKAKEKSGST